MTIIPFIIKDVLKIKMKGSEVYGMSSSLVHSAPKGPCGHKYEMIAYPIEIRGMKSLNTVACNVVFAIDSCLF